MILSLLAVVLYPLRKNFFRPLYRFHLTRNKALNIRDYLAKHYLLPWSGILIALYIKRLQSYETVVVAGRFMRYVRNMVT